SPDGQSQALRSSPVPLLPAAVEAVVAGGVLSEVPVVVVGGAVVVAAEGEAVVEVGVAAVAPGVLVVVDLAPGEGSFAAADGAGVVEEGQGAALGGGVEAGEAA